MVANEKDVTYEISNHQSLRDWLTDIELLMEKYGEDAELYVFEDENPFSELQWVLSLEKDEGKQ